MAKRLWRAVLVAVSLACYMGFVAYQLTLPGLEYDEVFFGPAALGRTRDFSSSSSPGSHFSPLNFNAFSLRLNSYSLPIMLMPYWGALKVYLLAPVFFLWGVSPWTIRLPAIGLGVFTLFLFYLVFARLFSSRVALVALAFLASDPSYIFYTRHDFGGAALSLLLMIAPLWCLARWSETSGKKVSCFDRLSMNGKLSIISRLVPFALSPSASLRTGLSKPVVSFIEPGERGNFPHPARTRLWGLAFFLFGLGLYHRLDYVGFLAAVGVVTLMFQLLQSAIRNPHSAFPMSRVGRREIVLAWFFFALGFSPFLIFLWNRPSIATSSLSLASPAQDFSSVARLKGYVLWTVLNGTSLYDFFSGRSGINAGKIVTEDSQVRVGSYAADRQPLLASSLFTGTLTPYFLLFFVFVFWFFHPPPALKTLGTFLVLLLLCLLAAKGALRGHHFVVFLPFAQAFLAASLLFVWEKVKQRWTRVTLVALGVAFVGTNLGVDLRYHRFLAATGGRGIWSEGIYDLASYLQERCPKRRCLIGDWGMGTQLVTLTGGGLPVEEFFWPYIKGGDEGWLDTLVRTEKALFIFYADPYINFSRPKHLFYAAAQRADLEVVVDRVFTERDGTPVIEVVRLKGKTRTHSQCISCFDKLSTNGYHMEFHALTRSP